MGDQSISGFSICDMDTWFNGIFLLGILRAYHMLKYLESYNLNNPINIREN